MAKRTSYIANVAVERTIEVEHTKLGSVKSLESFLSAFPYQTAPC